MVRELYGAGIIRQIWHRGDVPGACVILEAQTEAEARAVLEASPLAETGGLEIATIVPLKPYRGFTAAMPFAGGVERRNAG